LYTNALLSVHPSFLPAFELRWKSLAGLSLNDPDPDNDGLTTADELFIYRTDPRNLDSDNDGIPDGEEISLYGTDPNAFSSDASGEGDLWRILGGLSPSNAPYTSAMPSESVGILTITTLLVNAPVDGGAVLRIADQYIPVLAGTTLVSRIAIPRDATLFFILARGVNCDNATAQITVEASSFTKMRDPSGALSGSFTLSPSCVTASGTILMPSYTITPAAVCFHCPTSSVLRIVSADPDIYFSTGQGLVREYTPSAPENLPPGFTIGAVTGSLACAGSVFTVTAVHFTKAAHFCNPDGPGGWEDPNNPDDREDWYCYTGIYGHVVEDPHTESDCHCIARYENAYDCYCSGRGEYPCPCAHPVCDPHATPADEPHDGPPYKETRGHAPLEIGKDTALFPVTVPQGESEPCPRCKCAMNLPLSAYVFRQTGNINVAPSSLYTNGSFAVTGILPSTNFAAEVLTIYLKDTYIQQSFTALGTSVYPAETGHSVSNWFIGCGITNALTLWTGVKLPSDTGEVTLSVTVDSGTPSPQLYVYNRVTQSDDLLASPENLTFTQNLGDWRDTYCDTNGYAQAWLLCASSGVGRVTHSYETYSGQPYSMACSSEQRVAALKVESIDVTSSKLGTSQNPPPFAGGTNWIFCVTNSPSTDKHAVVLYKDVVDGSYNVQNFDVTLTATFAPSGFTTNPLTFHWEKISGPASGELMSSTDTSVVYRNPKQGGVYRFKLTIRNGSSDLAFGEANLVLPHAGAEMDSVVKTNLPMADAFVTRMKTKFGKNQLKDRDNLERWFYSWNSGDYVGRPDNQETPSVWYYGQVTTANSTNVNYGLGAVCTWKWRPVRLTKPSNFILGYAMQQLGISRIKAQAATLSLKNITDWNFTDSASVGAGWDVANGGYYDTTVSSLIDYIWTHEDENDKSRKSWPNPNPPDNDGGSSMYEDFDYDRQYAVPGFLFKTQ
ncbi:MAG: thrombospondin type 3 repeat-containing protein, partial [bacterium]